MNTDLCLRYAKSKRLFTGICIEMCNQRQILNQKACEGSEVWLNKLQYYNTIFRLGLHRAWTLIGALGNWLSFSGQVSKWCHGAKFQCERCYSMRDCRELQIQPFPLHSFNLKWFIESHCVSSSVLGIGEYSQEQNITIPAFKELTLQWKQINKRQ